MTYAFHRDFFDLMLNSINNNSVTFLLGAKSCGKTVCLRQLEESISNAKYIDFKTIPDKYKQIDIFRDIIDSINSNEDKVYLIDGITYVEDVDVKICEIAYIFNEVVNTKTKIVFTGSQSAALNAWTDRAFAENANKIYADFLSYPEYLRSKDLTEYTLKTYNQFLYEAADFHKFESLEAYLLGCIEETIISNANTYNCILDNDCDLIKDKVDLLINICYLAMFNLNNNAITPKIEKAFMDGYYNIISQDTATLREAFIFLVKCNLISIISITQELASVPDAYRSIRLNKGDIDCKKDLFKKFNITIKHPIIYIQVLKNILKNDMPTSLSDTLLESLWTTYECS